MASTFCCSARCGIVSGEGTSGTNIRHWHGPSGLPTIESVIVPRAGSFAFKCDGTSAPALQNKTGLTTAVFVGRARFYVSALPAANDPIVDATVAAGDRPQIRVRTDGTVEARWFTANTTQAGPQIAAATWFTVEWRFNMTTGVISWRVNGVAQTDLGVTQTATTIATIALGSAGATSAIIVYVTDILFANASGDHPLGLGQGVGLRPRADGTHSFSLAGDFEYNDVVTTPVLTGATDTWQSLDDPLDNVTDFLAANAAAAGEYLEWLFDAMPGDVASINAVEVVSAHHSAGTAANKQTLRLIDGGSTSDVFTDADFSITALLHNSKHYVTAPSGGAWSSALVDALKARWGSSWTAVDISPVPYIDGIVLEVDYVPAVAVVVRQPRVIGQAIHRAAFY